MKHSKKLLVLLITLAACIWVNAQPSHKQYQGILELVKSGDTETARIKVETYLEIFPDDAQLQQMAKALAINSGIRGVKSSSGVELPEPNVVVDLSVEDRLEVDTVVQMAQDVSAMQTEAVKHESSTTILKRPVPAAAHTSKHPEWFRYWLARAAMALEANYLRSGVEASNELKRLGILKSDNAFSRKILVQLNRKDWFGMKLPALPEEGKDYLVTLDSGIILEMLWVDPGTFMMGNNEVEDFSLSGQNQHLVTLTKGYWLGKFEVTQEQWYSIVGTSIREQRDRVNQEWSIHGDGADYPMYFISWNEAMAFCLKLSAQERSAGRLHDGYEYNLPTEAQWEYACRAGRKGVYSDEFSRKFDPETSFKAHTVGSQGANPWGFYGMHGNVAEWCRDWFDDHPSGKVVDPRGASSGTGRVIRPTRFGYDPAWGSGSIGFRLVMASTH